MKDNNELEMIAAIHREESGIEPGTIACDLCSAEVDSVEAAIAADWSPSYYRSEADEHETAEPICCECSSKKCFVNTFGELVRRPAVRFPNYRVVCEYADGKPAGGFDVYGDDIFAAAAKAAKELQRGATRRVVSISRI